MAYTYSSKIRLSSVTWSYGNTAKKKRFYHIPFMKPSAYEWYLSQFTSRQLHVLGVSDLYSLPLTPSLSTGAAEAQTGIHFLFCIIVTAALFAALSSFSPL